MSELNEAHGIPLVFAPPLAMGESLDGWIDVTASLYGISRIELLTLLSDRLGEPIPKSQDQDLAALSIGRRLLTLLETGPAMRNPSLRESLSWRMAPNRRSAYCPICFGKWVNRGELPRFQEEWTRCWQTHCSVHATPLFEWPWTEERPYYRKLPRWIAEGYLDPKRAHRSLRPPQNSRFGLHLNLARSSQHAQGRGNDVAIAWTHQLWLERMIISGGGDFWRHFIGGTRAEARNVLHDLVRVYVDRFEPDWSTPPIEHATQFMGPRWMFATFKGGYAEGALGIPLRFIDNPAQRRSVIAAVGRTLLGFSADFTCSSHDGRLVEAGETALTRDLDKVSNACKTWIRSRSSKWPQLAKVGILKSIR